MMESFASLAHKDAVDQINTLLMRYRGTDNCWNGVNSIRTFIITFDLDLIRREDLALEYRFLNAIPSLQLLQRRLSMFTYNENNLEEYPNEWGEKIFEWMKSVLSAISDICQFDPSTIGQRQLVEVQHKAYLRKAVELPQKYLLDLSNIILYLQKDTEKVGEKFTSALEEFQEHANEKLDLISKKYTELESLSDGIKKSAERAGITAESTHFQDSQEAYGKAAVGWLLISTVLFAILLLWAVLLLLKPELFYRENSSLFLLITSKLLLTAILVSALFFSISSYKANKHNQVVNKHRCDALKTYQALSGAAKGVHNGDVILMQAASCIYAPQDSGYNHKSADTNPISITLPTSFPNGMREQQ